MQRLDEARGFTVMELLVVAGALGLLATGAALGWARLESVFRLDAATHALAADLHDARVLAIASAARARLVFARGAASYRVERADDAGTFHLTALRALPRGVLIADANSSGDLVFSPRGVAENGTVVLVDRRGRRATLRLNQRGRVTIERGRT
ncbi:MAG: GspH/FimT family pseudopilin [Deltaproteobacteria bacterium]|nr:GspH/FimT family pseudopilin [Deltaproteobacteria bacterium]